MALVPIKSKSEIIAELITFIRSRHSNADVTPGTILRDLLIEAPAELIFNAQTLANFISRLTNFRDLNELLEDTDYKSSVALGLGIELDNVEQIISDTIDEYARNFGLSRKPGATATGQLTFYSTTQPNAGFSIPSGTVIRTASTTNALTYITQSTATIPANPDINEYLNKDTQYWEVTVSATAQTSGNEYNAPSNTVTQFNDGASAPAGVNVTNKSNFSGGLDIESNGELLNRISYAFTGNFAGTASSILAGALLLNYVSDAEIVYKLDDPDRIREASYEADVWVSAFDSTLIEEDSVTALDADYVIPSNTPVISVNSVIIQKNKEDEYALSSAFYALSSDVLSTLRYSSFAQDKIIFSEAEATWTETSGTVKAQVFIANTPISFPDYISGGPISAKIIVSVGGTIDSGWKYDSTTSIYKNFNAGEVPVPGTPIKIKIRPEVGDTVALNYFYNSRISAVQKFLEDDTRAFVGQDILAREALKIPIVISILVQSDGTRSDEDVKYDIESELQTEINTLKLNQEINESTLVALIKGVAGVVDVRIPFDQLRRSTDDPNTSGDITLKRFEYAELSNISVTVTRSKVVS